MKDQKVNRKKYEFVYGKYMQISFVSNEISFIAKQNKSDNILGEMPLAERQ